MLLKLLQRSVVVGVHCIAFIYRNLVFSVWFDYIYNSGCFYYNNMATIRSGQVCRYANHTLLGKLSFKRICVLFIIINNCYFKHFGFKRFKSFKSQKVNDAWHYSQDNYYQGIPNGRRCIFCTVPYVSQLLSEGTSFLLEFCDVE